LVSCHSTSIDDLLRRTYLGSLIRRTISFACASIFSEIVSESTRGRTSSSIIEVHLRSSSANPFLSQLSMKSRMLRMDHQYSFKGRVLLTYGYRERAATGSSSEDSNSLFKISKMRSLVAKSWYIVKKVALKRSFLDGPSMSVMARKTRPSRFPADTVPSVAGRSKHSESLAAISIKPRTTGLTGSQLRLWGKSIDKVADRVG
jgi:hypothetical protein